MCVCVCVCVCGAFNKFPAFFFVQAFKIVVDSWEFSMLLLYILWDDWPVFMISENFHGAFQKSLERFNKCIATEVDYFEGDLSFMCVLSIKVPIRNKSGNLFNDPRIRSENAAISLGLHGSINYISFWLWPLVHSCLWSDNLSHMLSAERESRWLAHLVEVNSAIAAEIKFDLKLNDMITWFLI